MPSMSSIPPHPGPLPQLPPSRKATADRSLAEREMISTEQVEGSWPVSFWCLPCLIDCAGTGPRIEMKPAEPVLLRTEPDEERAPEVLEQLVRRAELAGASDIHLHRRNDCAEISFRLDGVLTPIQELP